MSTEEKSPTAPIVCKFPGCNIITKRRSNGKNRFKNTYNLYCCRSHAARHVAKDSVVAREKTCLTKYGTSHPAKSDEIKIKTAATNHAKYGTHPSKLQTTKDKMESTMYERFGVKNVSQCSAIKRKKEETCLKNYGTKYPMQSGRVRDRSLHSMVDKHGVKYNTQRHLDLDIIECCEDEKKFIELVADGSFSDAMRLTGLSASRLRNYYKKYNINLDKRSIFEADIISTLSSEDLIENSKSIIPPLQLDIYLPDHKIAIECNGSYYHSEKEKGNSTSRGRDYHLNKTKLCEEQGIQLIHIWEHDWNRNPELIKRRLLSKLGKNERIFARKTQLTKLTTETARNFLNQHHLQGTCPASVKYGLYVQDELVAVMTLGKSRFSKTYEWELLRYCSTKQVIGGASKLFKHFQREHQPKSVVSYSDKMWNTGNLYKQLGFEHSHVSKPSYYYTKNYLDFENRVAYQKHKLHKKLEHFDPNLTEWENMQENGFDRIWDCGSDVWAFTNTY